MPVARANDIAFTYLVDGENEQVHLTYAELDGRARAIGAWLESLGLVGQRALLLYPPGLEFITAFFGCLYAGVAAAPVYPPRRNRSMARIQAIADDAQAKVALTTDVVLNRVEAIIDETPHLKELTWLDTCHVPGGLADRWELPDIHGDTLAFLQYTSGSTGTPKGVVLNHANLVHNSALIAYAFENTRSGKGVFWLPSYHDMGLIGGILQPLYIGRPNVLMSPMTFLQKPYRWLSAISRFAGTTSGGPNFAYDLCVRKITPEQRKTLDLSSWRLAFNGAEPVRAETLDRFAEVFGPCGFRREAFYPCYGLAEATLIVSGGYVERPPVVRDFQAQALLEGRAVAAPPGAEGARRLVGCGEDLPDQKIAIVDPERLTSCPTRQHRRNLGPRPQRRPRLLESARGFRSDLPRLREGHRRGAFPPHRRPRLHRRERRVVRHRPGEGPDHRPRSQLLSARHRDDRPAQPSAVAAWIAARRSPSSGTAASCWSWSRKSNGTSRTNSCRSSRRSAGRFRSSTISVRTRSSSSRRGASQRLPAARFSVTPAATAT